MSAQHQHQHQHQSQHQPPAKSMNGYAPETIEAVRAATDLVALIREDIDLRKAGKDFEARCPFHDEKTPSFTVSPDKQFYHCFGCGAHGDALDWMRDYHHLPFRHALEALAGRSGILLGAWTTDELKSRRARRVESEVEEAMVHELHVLLDAVGARVSYRQIPRTLVERYPHIQEPPARPYEREVEAAKRLSLALYAVYGVGVKA